MKTQTLHSWNVTVSQAAEIQDRLRTRVIIRDLFTSINHVCGVDVGFKEQKAVASCVVMSYPDLEVVEHVLHRCAVAFPYIPGLLSFREIPALLPALEKLKCEPDLIIADGQGIAHGRGLGLASHLGILLDLPTIGCAKSRLVGTYAEPGAEKGSWEYLYLGDDVIGAVVRTRKNVKPLFVSVGHGISLQSAIFYTLTCCTSYRLTEPIRFAHRFAGGKA
jgi:deoxyribonuclease V